ncbi:hypothetical protein INT45_014126 [Circinella minor]|uniref:Ndc10 domain-containing protein n=1 Tax=Circinella minor TaxID=1195481 RepID=A0A8H7VCW4_9FUNG|nr:hypothetical protein INT45_014126 [Circinella minor]
MGGSGSGRRQINGTPAQNRERNRDIRLNELSLNNSAVADMENDEDVAYRDARDRAALATFSAAQQSCPQNTINYAPEDSHEDDANQHHSNEHRSNGGTNVNNDDADDDLNDLSQIDAAYQVMDMMDEMDEDRDGLSSITLTTTTTNNSSPPPINSINTESPITQQFDENARLASKVTGKRVRYSTVEAYAAAIVDLWAEQCLTDNSFRPSPRGKRVKALLDWLHREDEKIAHANFDDRFWSNGTELGLRDGALFLLQHYGLLRSESIRKMEFADLQSLHLEDEGPSQCHALVMILKQGKINKFGRVEVAGCMRNKNMAICPQMMLACYFFSHYEMSGEQFPSINKNADWHLRELVSIQKPKLMLRICGAAARMAEIGGSSEGTIRRAGRWNTSLLTTAYLTNLPHELLRTLTCFPTERGYFYLSHANVQPPEELCKKIFKFVDYWRQKLDEGNVEQVSCAADMFLKLLDGLRVVFLQDSVLLKKRYPHHYLWNHPLFQSELYKDFERCADAAVEITEEPEQLQLQKTVPLVAQHLSDINQQIASCFDAQA